MLVYGETSWTGDPRRRLVTLSDLVREAIDERPGIVRHGRLVAALIEAGELAQGIADAEFHERGHDAPSPAQEAAMGLLMGLARSVWDSWRTEFEAEPGTPDLANLAAAALPQRITTRWAEGFAFYALYPESYALAAARSGLSAATRVIGIRSIGAPLGAMVAAGLGAEPPLTFRPVGHPFRRELSLGGDLRKRLTAADRPRFAIADEGPGLSGSSFGAVIDTLEGVGVPRDSIAVFPSHPGAPGSRAELRHRARWDRMPRHIAPFEDVVLADGRLSTWVADLIGPAEAPPVEISGGRWRALQGRSEGAWPPVNAQQERRKFLLRAGGATWLIKFAGLGAQGYAKLDRARALHAAGFTPPVAGYRHGFLVERWVEDAQPLDVIAIEPDAFIDQLGRYLGFRARSFASGPDRGASLAALLAMARHNLGEALGPEWTRPLDRWSPDRLAGLAQRAHPVEIDGRMQPWKFLIGPDRRLLKCDALDHHAAHDLVGCQDIAWDIAGASVELGLSDLAREHLGAIVERASGRPVDPDLVALLIPCYLAFQLGAASMAADATSDPAEISRLRRSVAYYTGHLRRILSP